MDFKSKTVEEVLVWLEKKGYDEWVREIFEGSCCCHTWDAKMLVSTGACTISCFLML